MPVTKKKETYSEAHFDFRTYDRFEAGSVFLGDDEIELVTGVYLGCRGRYLDFAVGGREQARNDKVTFDDVVELAHCLAFDQGVGHFDRLHERSGVGVGEFVLDSLDFIVNLDTEDAFDEEHRADDAADAERIGGGITHSHCVDGIGKGGNLAEYAAVNLPDDLQKQIKTIYTFDSPGLSTQVDGVTDKLKR